MGCVWYVLYPEYIVPENFYFWWPSRIKIQHIYQRILKGGNGYHKYLRCSDIRGDNFYIMRSEISLNKVDQVCAEIVKDKTTGKYSDFIAYPNTIYFDGKWLDSSDYLKTK